MDRTTEWLAIVYESHHRGLFLTAWNIVRCEDLAEDAVHAAFCRMTSLRQVPKEPKTYVFRAVRNAAIDIRRQRDRRNEQGLSAELESRVELESYAERDSTTRAELEDARHEFVEYAMRMLDDQSQEIIELHLQGGLTFREIGTITDTPLQTVASRYRRGLQQMRTELEINDHLRHPG